MKSIIASLFTIYQLTTVVNSNRLLLQVGPPQVGPPQVGPPAVELPPVEPPQVGPPQYVPEPQPQQPEPQPQQPAPQPPIPTWVAPVLPNPANLPGSGTFFLCDRTNTDPKGCAGRTTDMVNPTENFNMECLAIGSCAAATLNFAYGPGSHGIQRVQALTFAAAYSGYGTTVNIDSTLSPGNQYLDKLECKEAFSCMNTVIQCIGGASVNDVNCAMPNHCSGCLIKDCEWILPGGADNPVNELLCGAGKACFNY